MARKVRQATLSRVRAMFGRHMVATALVLIVLIGVNGAVSLRSTEQILDQADKVRIYVESSHRLLDLRGDLLEAVVAQRDFIATGDARFHERLRRLEAALRSPAGAGVPAEPPFPAVREALDAYLAEFDAIVDALVHDGRPPAGWDDFARVDARLTPLLARIEAALADIQTALVAQREELYRQGYDAQLAIVGLTAIAGSLLLAVFLLANLAQRRYEADAEYLRTVEARRLSFERKAREAAESSSHAKDDVLSTLSHELRTPLQAILGWSAFMQRFESDPVKTSRALQAIERCARMQVRLIDDLLDSSRLQRGMLTLDRVPMDLGATVLGAVEGSRPLAEQRGIRLVAHLPPGPVAIHGDKMRVKQVIWNLLSNAFKFTPAGGTVEVTLGPGSATTWSVRVRDTGKGLAAEELERVFERYWQADGSHGRTGLGLGLSIARELVEAHDGQVRVRSDGPDRGAEFEVELPRASDAPPAATAKRSEGMPLAGGTILLVEDAPDVRELLATLLGAEGAQVHTAADTVQAEAVLARTNVDVLLCDIGLPGEDGYSYLRRLRARGFAAPAIALTAYASERDRTLAREAGFTSHQGKPIDIDALLGVVGAIIRGAPPVPDPASTDVVTETQEEDMRREHGALPGHVPEAGEGRA